MKKKYLVYFLPALLFTIFYWSVSHKYPPGIWPDSFSYYQSAKNFSEGKGPILDDGNLINHWPPGYPIVLGTFSKITGLSIEKSAYWLNIVLVFLLNFFLVKIAELLGLETRQLFFIPLLMFFSVSMMYASFMLSDFPFIVFLMLSVWIFLKWIHSQHTGYLVLAGFLSGLLFMIRYAAVGFIGGMLLYIIIQNRKSIKKIIRDILYFSFPFLAVILMWYLYYSLGFEHKPVDRHFSFKPIPLDKLKNALDTIIDWFMVKKTLSLFVIWLVFFLLVLYSINLKKILVNLFKNRDTLILILLPFSYFLFLIFSISFFDHGTPLDKRILAPVFPFLLFILAMIFQHLNPRLVLINYIVLLYLVFMASWIQVWGNYPNRLGFNSSYFIKTMNALNKENWHHKAKNIYSNGDDLLHYQLGIKSLKLPYTDYPGSLKELKTKIERDTSIVIYLKDLNRSYFINSKTLIKTFPPSYIEQNDGYLIVRNPDFFREREK